MNRTCSIAIALFAASCSTRADSSTSAGAKTVEAEPGARDPNALPTLAGLFACHSTGAAPSPKSTLPFVPTRCPGIPSLFGGVAFGMTRAQAQKVSDGGEITADLNGNGWSRFPEIDPHGWARTFSYSWSKADKLTLLDVELTEPELAELKTVWGEPLSYGDGLAHYLAWFAPAAHIRVQARPTTISKRDGDVRGYSVEIEPYVPLAELVKELAAQPMFGKSLDQIAAMFPGALEVTTKAQKAAELKSVDPKLEGLASDDWIDLRLPRAELESVRLRLEIDEHRLVKAYSFAFQFWKDKALGDELLATTIAALGQPTVGHSHGATSYGFTGKGGIRVKAELDPQFGMLSFEVTPAATTH